MFLKKSILFIVIAFLSLSLSAQKDSITDVKKVQDLKISGNIKTTQGVYDPLAPSKAAFYSAIFPGLGQIYNKKYWKAPIVWGALAIPVYYYQINNRDYSRFRNAYRLRQNGLTDEFTINGVETVSTETLETAQEQLRENRDFSILSGIIIYILQIVEASVNAHLMQFNTDDNLTFKPTLIQDPISFDAPTVGLTIKYNF
ncbi:DUF5683 domain-containing protein [Polaribacter dokdonensis]|uniref:DUF5683 domain-containing protein n=1 Tax=Polaribacter dokdonensis DSW-5 TaxID=1300348 RepID=A0A0N0CEK3_9FLAO|nr:DUF5683 domain-containing protein [Polaribacter dokdonensis]KOY50520.1 hypothetical protein I602_80 [Polaribacter dokdonensis DSW-5]SEE60118.1 hypothetical protein SAMN05444353_2644 [Polaribacter dokdonensis DSW-5]